MPRVPDTGQIELTRGELNTAFEKVNAAIDTALDAFAIALAKTGLGAKLEREALRLRLASLAQLRRQIKTRMDDAH